MVRTYSASKTQIRWTELYPVICLIFLATAPAVFLGEGNRNLSLIALMFISPLFTLRRTLSTEAVLLLGFALSIVFFPAFVHSGGTRWSTILYSLMFCGLFISYDGMLRQGKLRLASFLNIMRYLIIAYAVVLLIQQLCVLLGLPIFNLSNYDPSERWKLNSLSPEPSHSARIIGLLMFSYILGSRLLVRASKTHKVSQRQYILLWLCFFWTMITMMSATALVMVIIVLVTNTQGNGIRFYGVSFLLAIFAIFFMPGDLTERIFAIASAALTLDYEAVLNADHSGAMRIAPMLVLLDKSELFSVSGIFGNGVDSVSLFMSDYIWGVAEGTPGGGLLALWYEYGLISFLFFVLFTLYTTSALKSPAGFLIWFSLIFIASVNSQMVWLAIILLHTLSFYRQKLELVGTRENLSLPDLCYSWQGRF